MKNFKIEKNVPIPDFWKNSKQGKYPFKQMEVGDSFNCGKYSREYMTKICNAARNWSKSVNSGYKFKCRKLKNDTFRIWRIE